MLNLLCLRKIKFLFSYCSYGKIFSPKSYCILISNDHNFGLTISKSLKIILGHLINKQLNQKPKNPIAEFMTSHEMTHYLPSSQINQMIFNRRSLAGEISSRVKALKAWRKFRCCTFFGWLRNFIFFPLIFTLLFFVSQ